MSDVGSGLGTGFVSSFASGFDLSFVVSILVSGFDFGFVVSDLGSDLGSSFVSSDFRSLFGPGCRSGAVCADSSVLRSPNAEEIFRMRFQNRCDRSGTGVRPLVCAPGWRRSVGLAVRKSGDVPGIDGST